MYKNASILHYFKPSTQSPRLNKRSLPEDSLEDPRAIRRSRSTAQNKGPTKQDHYLEEEPPKRSLRRASSTVTLRSLSRQPSGPEAEESMVSATPARIFSDETSYSPMTPNSTDSTSQKDEVLGSQCTSLLSSQRVVKNGEVVIKNSDGESDSDSSLEDLSSLLLEGRRAWQESSDSDSRLPASSRNAELEDGRRMRTRRRNKTDTVAAPLRSALPMPPKRYKYDLESLARHRRQEQASIEDVTKANAMLRSFEQQEVFAGGKAMASSTKRPFDTAFIDTVMKEHGNGDEISRLKAAIQRTEALHYGKSWSFFVEQAKEPLFEQPDFPIIEGDHLGRLLGKTFSRQQAFLCGYVGELEMRKHLPEEILLWVLDAICLESRDDLRHSYTTTLTDASRHLTSILSPERVDMLFRQIGATAAALNVKGPVIPHPALSQSIEAVGRPNLLSILVLFQQVASCLGAETRVHLIGTLCRLVLDQSITNNCHIMSAIEDTFASLIESVPEQDLDHELRMVMTTAFESISDATLRLRLLQSILASSHRLILLRRRFARACFFRDVGHLSQLGDVTIDLKTIAHHLEGQQFIISNVTDYGELAATIGILSIAIDSGDLPSSSYAPEEKAFNRDVDSLALKIKTMFTDINDTGGSHIGRTEAKEVLEVFQHWLSYGVRTKPPPKQCLFGDSTLEGTADRHMMEAFVDRGKQDTALALPDSMKGRGEQKVVAAS